MPADLIIIPSRSLTGVPQIQFSGCSGTSLISLQVLQDGSVSFQGGAGQLFGISDSLTGVLMGVYDIAGLPIMEVSSNDMVTMGTYNSSALVVSGRRVGIGTASPAFTLDVTGATQLRNTLTLGSGIILGTSNVTGGGIAFGSNATLHALSATDLQIGHPNGGFTTQYLYGGSNLGGLFNGANSAGEGIYFSAATNSATIQTANQTALLVSGNQKAEFRQSVSAKTYIIPPSGVATPVMLGNPATVSGVLNIDVSAAGLQTVTITGNTLISGINHVAGGATTIRIYAATGGVSSIVQQLAFSTGWRFVSTMPTGLLINKALVLTVQCFDATDSGICAAAAVQS